MKVDEKRDIKRKLNVINYAKQIATFIEPNWRSGLSG